MGCRPAYGQTDCRNCGLARLKKKVAGEICFIGEDSNGWGTIEGNLDRERTRTFRAERSRREDCADSQSGTAAQDLSRSR